MKMRRLIILCALLPFGAAAQTYAPPMRGELLFSSSYGELRSANIHTGVDIKTGAQTGLPVYAAMDGYIARIGIKPYGYGKVLYIAHPNGMTTVYGHLEAFMPEVETYVRQKRYETEENSVDLWLKPTDFIVKKGGQIAFSGNTGRSGGPHLHFEVRETASQRLFNPVLRGAVRVNDTTPPQIRNIYYYEVDTIAGAPIHRRVQSFTTASTTARLSRTGYFVVEAVDTKNGTNNIMGVSTITERVDGRIRFIYQNDGITFSNTPLHTVIAPYDLRTSGHPSAVRMARYAGLKLPFYGLAGSTGVIDPARDKRVEFDVEDDCGNHATLALNIVYSPAEAPVFNMPEYSQIILPTKEYSQTTGALTVIIPAGTIFEPIFYRQIETEQRIISLQPRYSAVYQIGEATAPLRKSYSIAIEVTAPENLHSKLMLARVNSNSKLSSAGGKYRNGAVSGTAGSFGMFCVTADTVAPIIKPQFADGVDASRLKSLIFSVSDDFSGIASYRAEVDGRWAILEFDTMQGRLIYEFDDQRCGIGKIHTIRLTITDNTGNQTVNELKFKR